MITQDFTTIEEVRTYVTDRMLFFSMWERTFRKSELDYKASLSRDNQPGRTHAAGALGGTNEEGDKSSDSNSNSDSDSEGHGEAGQSEDQAAKQSQHGDTRPDGGTMTRDCLGDGAGDQEQDQPAGMESWRMPPRAEQAKQRVTQSAPGSMVLLITGTDKS